MWETSNITRETILRQKCVQPSQNMIWDALYGTQTVQEQIWLPQCHVGYGQSCIRRHADNTLTVSEQSNLSASF